MSFVLARSTDWRGPDSALGWLLLSFLYASRVFLFSPPLTQKLFSEKHLISAEFGPEWSGIASARAFCVSLAFWQACLSLGASRTVGTTGCCRWESVCRSFSVPKRRETNTLLQPDGNTSLLGLPPWKSPQGWLVSGCCFAQFL